MVDLILAADCGTQSLRAMIFNKDGTILAMEKESYEPYYPNDIGVCEKHPDDYINAFFNCTKKLGKTGLLPRVSGLIITTIRDTGVYLDKDGKVIRNSIHFLDQREAKTTGDLPLIYALPSKIIGMYEPIMDSKKQGNTNWVIENEPEIWKKTKHYLLLSGYFNYRLSGKYVDSVSNQIGHIPINFKSGDWDKKGGLYDFLFPMSREILPTLVPTGTVIGKILPEIAEKTGLNKDVVLIAGSSDKGCETLGTGCINEKSVSISFGTAATIQTTSKKYIEPIKYLPAYPAAICGMYNPEIQVYRGYWMIRWFKREFSANEVMLAEKMGVSPEEILNSKIENISPGSDGLLLQPYWKPDLKNPNARGAIIGFTDTHNKYHIYRAILEGINFALYDGLKKIEKKTHIPVETIYVSGGGSKSDLICQLTADMFGIKVVRGETNENSGLGAAILAYVSLKEYSDYDEAISNMVRPSKIFIPNKETNKIYNRIYQSRYKKIYPRLKAIYKDIRLNRK